MSHALSNRISASNGDSQRLTCTTSIHKLITVLTDKYGMPVHQAHAMDEPGLILTAATLDFLSNNLPPQSEITAATLETSEV